jgi:hypothetical protein
LSNRGVHADHIGPALPDHGVDRDGRLPGSAIADDELALASTEGERCIDDQHAGCERPIDERSIDDRRRRTLDGRCRRGSDRFAPIEGPAQRIDHAPEQRLPDRHPHHIARSTNDTACGDF